MNDGGGRGRKENHSLFEKIYFAVLLSLLLFLLPSRLNNVPIGVLLGFPNKIT